MVTEAILHYFLRTHGAGHTPLMIRSIARELMDTLDRSIAVWAWTMAEADRMRRSLRAELESAGPHMNAEIVDRCLARVKWFSTAGGSPAVGLRAPAFVDNHVVIELAADLDRTRSELRRARDVIGHQEQKLDDLMLAHHLDELAKRSMRQRIKDLMEAIDAKQTELEVLRSRLDDVE